MRRATLEAGRAITLDLARAGLLSSSLAEGDYPGTHAFFLKGPGRSYVSYHCDGMTRLSL